MTASFYDILGVPHHSTREQISHAYRRLAMRHHPDHGGDLETMAGINSAYEALQDSDTRRAYDLCLRTEAPAPSDPAFEHTGTGLDPTVGPPPESGPAELHVLALTVLMKTVDAFAAVILRILASDSLSWLICYALILLLLASILGRLFATPVP